MKNKAITYYDDNLPFGGVKRDVLYRRTSNLLDAIIGNKNVIFYSDINCDTSRSLEDNSVRQAITYLRARKIITRVEAKRIGSYYPYSYLECGKRILCEYSVKEIIKCWGNYNIRTSVISNLKWKHYYEGIIPKSCFITFQTDVRKAKTPLDLSIVILRYKAKIKKHKNNGSLQTF